jgi:hypothetical protein
MFRRFSMSLLLCAAIFAQIPQTIQYQGKLTDVSGVGENAELDMRFRIFDVETDGDSLWAMTIADVPIVHGLFDVSIGPIDLPFDEQYWLEIVVDGNVLAPRVQLTTSPYAFRAAVADSFTGGVSPWTQDTMVAHWDSIRGVPAGLGLPGGSHGQVQFNNGGAFGGSPGFIFDNSTGYVGIGSPGAWYPLSVYKSADMMFVASIENRSATGWGLEIRTKDTTSTRSSFEVYNDGIQNIWIRNSGKVGIGVDPTCRLDVAGKTKTTDFQMTTGATDGYILQSDASGNAGWVSPTTISDGDWTRSGSRLSTLNVSDSVVIGGTTAYDKLDVNGSMTIRGDGGSLPHGSGLTSNEEYIRFPGSESDYIISVQDGSGRIQHYWNSTTASPSNLYLMSNERAWMWDISIATHPYMEFKYAPAGLAGDPITWTTHMAFDTLGNVNVLGDITANAFIGDGSGLTGIADGNWIVFGDNMYSAVSGNIGIGTSNPVDLLHVEAFDDTVGADDSVFISVRNKCNSDSAIAGIRFKSHSTDGNSFYKSAIAFQRTKTYGRGDLHFIMNDQGNNWNADISSTKMTLTSAGQLGIGTRTPSAKLDVADRMRVRQGPEGTAGIWLYQTTPALDKAFIGMKNDTIVGFYGQDGSTWGLIMHTRSGNVGIGTTTPNAKLSVQNPAGLGSGDANLKVYKNSSSLFHNGSALVAYSNDSGTAGGFNYSIARLGCYDTLPGGAISETAVWGHLNNGYSKCGVLATYGSNPVSPTRWAYLAGNDYAGYFSDNVKIDNNLYTMRRIGIGTTDPVDLLHVEAFDDTVGIDDSVFISVRNKCNSDSAIAGIRFKSHSFDGNIFYKSAIVFQRTNTWGRGDLHFLMNDHESNYNVDISATKMTLTSAGQLGIGTTTPGGKTEIYSNSTGSWPHLLLKENGADFARLFFANTDTTAFFAIVGKPADDPANAKMNFFYIGDRMTIQGDGNVGIGTTSPGWKLHVNGSAAKPGGGSWTDASDIRLKDVHSQFNRGLEALSNLQPVEFSYKADNPLELPSDRTYIGLIAQDVQKTIPEAIERDSKGSDYLYVNNDPIIWTMLNAIKELKVENDELKAENERQNTKNAQLESRIERLEKLVGQ